MQIRLNKIPSWKFLLSKVFTICLLFSILAFTFNACDRENPCDSSLCENGECVLSIDSVATTEGANIQVSDTLTTSFRILTQEGTITHQNKTFPLVNSLLIASNVEISKTSNIPNSTAVFSLLTFPACDCFTGWDGVRCDDPAPCDGVTCSNQGTAIEVDDETCRCECEPGFKGDLCETADPCGLITCANNSQCEVNDLGEGECVCDRGYQPPCIVEIRKKFFGEYTVNLDSCSTTRDTLFNVPQSILPYPISIKEDSTDIEYILIDSTNTFGILRAKVTIDNEIIVQDTTDQMDIVQSLEGTFTTFPQTIDLLLKIDYSSGGIDTCRFILNGN